MEKDTQEVQVLFLARDLFEDIDHGKTVTIRKGRRDVQLGKLRFLSPVEDGEEQLQRDVDVTYVMYCKAIDVPIDLLMDDGFEDHDDMLEGMKRFYPDFEEDTECTVVIYEPL
jgi:hypothetical protein